jgi:hypothetical protein
MLGQPPGIAALARMQLAAWEQIADDWPVSLERDTWRCGDCGGPVALALDAAKRTYQYTGEQFRALIVLHLRNHHADLDPDVA